MGAKVNLCILTQGGREHTEQKNTSSMLYFTFFSTKKLVHLLILKEVKPSPDRKMTKLLTLIDNLFLPSYILTITRSRIMTAITFFRQNDAGSPVSNTRYWQNLVLVVVLVSESKAELLLYMLLAKIWHWPRNQRTRSQRSSHVRVRCTQTFLACVLVSVCETHASAIKQFLDLMTVHTLYSLYFAFLHNFLYFTTSG